MKWDESRVYTALNAEKLKIGSTVVVADTIFKLRLKVEKDCEFNTIQSIDDECTAYRFVVGDNGYLFAYLVEEPEEKILKWTDLKIGDIIRHKITKAEHLVTGIHYDQERVFFGGEWADDEVLVDWEK